MKFRSKYTSKESRDQTNQWPYGQISHEFKLVMKTAIIIIIIKRMD
jgi:uncharacterized protein (UPF0333 family)